MTENDIAPWHRDAFLRLRARGDRLPHALLLHGKQGIGKARFARTLAASLLCETASEQGACGTCPSCTWFLSGSHPDFRSLEPQEREDSADEGGRPKTSAHIVVEQVRDLGDFLSVSTHRGGWRPVLVHPAEALNANAANALLKSLEEPPPRTLFILVTNRLHQVLPTIKSRCQLVALPAPSGLEASEWLKANGIEAPELVAAHTGGAPLLAMERSSQSYWEQRRRFLGRLTARKLDPLGIADECQDAGIPVVLEWLQKWTYDVAMRRLTGALRYNIDHKAAIDALAAACDPLRILRFHRELLKMQRYARHPLNVRLFLEQVVMAYADAAAPRLPS